MRWNWLARCLTHTSRSRRRADRRKVCSRRPRLEILEDRTLPSTVSWINPAGGDWSNPANWSTGQLPGANDDVVIKVPSNVTVTHASPTASDTVHSLVTTANFAMQGGTLTINGPSIFKSALSVFSTLTTNGNTVIDGPVELVGGAMNGSGNVTLNGQLTWTGGNIAGAGTVLAKGGLILDNFSSFSFSEPTLDGRTLQNAGTATWVGIGNFDLIDSATFVNLPGATFNINSDLTLNSDLGPLSTFQNEGTLVKSQTVGQTTFNTAFNNSGAVDVQSGTLALAGGGDETGSFKAEGPGTLNFTQGVYTLESSSSVSGPGTTLVSNNFSGNGTTVVVAGAFDPGTLSVTDGVINFTNDITLPTLALSGGAITGAGTLTVSGLFHWSGGTLTGPGTTVAGSSLVIDEQSGFQPVLNGRTLDVKKNAVLESGATLSVKSEAAIDNLSGATFLVQSGAAVNSDETSSFNNQGTLHQSGNPSGTTPWNMQLNNSGKVVVQSGTLGLAGGNDTGSFVVNSGAALGFGADTNLQPGSRVTGAGSVSFSGGTTNVYGTYAIAGDTVINGGTVDFTHNVTLPTLDLQSGTLEGPGTVTVSGLLNWTGGVMSGSGLTIAQGSLLLDGPSFSFPPADPTLDGRTFDNVKTATWANGNLQILDNGVFNNLKGATFLAQSSGEVATSFFSAATGTFNNAGTLQESGNTTSAGIVSLFTNSGQVNVQSGTLSIGPGTDTGTFTVQAGATLSLNSPIASGIINLSPTSKIVGKGAVNFSNGITNVDGQITVTGGDTISGGTVNFDQTITLPSLNLTGGTLAGSGTVTITGPLTWTGGAMTGPGLTVAKGALVLDGSGLLVLDDRTLQNTSTATWLGTGNLDIADAAVFDNLPGATFRIENDATASDSLSIVPLGQGIPVFKNEGRLVKSPSVGQTTFSTTFDNSGTVNVQSGTLALAGGGDQTGSFTVAAGATLNLSMGSFTFDPSSSVTGAGTVLISGTIPQSGNVTTVYLGGTYAPTTTVVDGASVNFARSDSLPNLTINGAEDSAIPPSTISGVGTLDVTGTLAWTNGTIRGPFLVRADSNLLISPTSPSVTLDGATLENVKSGTLGSGNLSLNNGSVFKNLAGAKFALQSGATVSGGFPNSGTFDNEGLLDQPSSAGTTTIASTFTNNGTLDVEGGTLSLQGIFTNYAALTLNGGTYLIAGTLQFNPVTASGSGGSGLTANAAKIVLNGPSAQITDLFGNNLMDSLTLNQSSGQLTLENGASITTASDFSNAGALTVGSGSTFTASGAYTQTGGSTILQAGTLTASSGVSIQGGSLSGPGTINADVVNAGLLNPGGTSGGTGLLTINGNYTQTAMGILHIGLAGTTADSQYDQLAVSGTATLAGTLDVTLLHGFQPQNGNQFQVLTYGSRNGTFTKYRFPSLGGSLVFDPVYGSGSLILFVQM
jgi:hypothetical protein